MQVSIFDIFFRYNFQFFFQRSCFIEYFTHKFRATIGKSKIFEKDEMVLLPYSSSGSSVAMLHLIRKVFIVNSYAVLKKLVLGNG